MEDINQNSIEPQEFFEDVKTRLQKGEAKKFDRQLEIIKDQIIKAKKLGQKTFLNRLVFTHNTIIKEQQLLAAGFDTFILKDEALKFIRLVTPKNSVKIIELDRYPRAIPEENQKQLAKAQELNLFDQFIVMFTDLSDRDYKTQKERDFVNRNRDPIIFGMFKHDKTGLKHERLYYITCWQDEYCDLDFATMVQKMAEVGMSDPTLKINTDVAYLNKIVSDVSEEMDTAFDVDLYRSNTPKKSWWKRIFS